MEFFNNIKTSVGEFLNELFTSMTSFFQDINLDGSMKFFIDNHLIVCSLVFIGMLVYFIAFDKKRSYIEFTNPINIIIFLACIPIYSFLADRPISLEFIGLGTIPIHAFILAFLGKYYGPLLTATFGGLEYFLSYVNNPDHLMFSVFFIYAIGGFIHGWLLYEEKTSFWRCFLARLLTVILCNIILLSFVQAKEYSHNSTLSGILPSSLLSGIIQLPIQAVISYVALLLAKQVKNKLEFD